LDYKNEFGFGLLTHHFKFHQATAYEVAEEGKMKDERFNLVIQVPIDACPVSVDQGFKSRKWAFFMA
jgi:hypothetical protein